MEIIWRPSALDDLESARRYIAESNPRAARRVFAAIIRSVLRLAEFPAMGRPGRVGETRELVVARTPYIVAYAVSDREITILAVMHGARKWPDRF